MAFADHYDLETFRRSQQAGRAARRRGTDADCSEQRKAMTAFVTELVAEKRMGRLEGLRGRRIRVADAWNAHIDGREIDWHWSLVQRLATFPALIAIDVLFERENRDYDRPLDETEIEKAYALLCKRMDEGDLFSNRRPLLDDLEDSKTSDRVRIEVTGWQPRLMRLDEAGGYAWVPAADVGPLPLAAEDFDLPSGDLLLSDYVRVEGITKAIEDDELGVGSDAGQLDITRALAAKHAMAYCQTTNTSVAVFRIPATGAIAIYDRYDPKTEDTFTPAGLEFLGTFSCDVWRITGMDIVTARRLATEGGNPDPKAVDKYLALAGQPDVWPSKRPWAEVMPDHHNQCYSRNVLRVQVAPGRWTMHCGSDFSKRANRKRFGLPKGGKLWCVMTPNS